MTKREIIVKQALEKLASSMRQRLDKTKSNATGKTKKSTRFDIRVDNRGNLKAKLELPDGARFVDKGRRAGTMPPVSEIRKWMAAKGIRGGKGTAFAIAKSIAREGTKGNRFFSEPFDQFVEEDLERVKQDVAAEFKREVQKTIKQSFK